METVRVRISVLEWPALVRLFANSDGRTAYAEFHAALTRSALSVELPRETALLLHRWLLECAMRLGTSPHPADRTDGLHVRDVAYAIERALGVLAA